jgi:3-methyladenine DNA glycosylase/8-oxoguanine DNA glycosylase
VIISAADVGRFDELLGAALRETLSDIRGILPWDIKVFLAFTTQSK